MNNITSVRIKRLIREFKNQKAAAFTIEELAMVLRLFDKYNPPSDIEIDAIEVKIKNRIEDIKDTLETLENTINQSHQTRIKCDMCDKPAIWVRHTQFSGDHFFCDDCAKKENNFGKKDDSGYYWEKI